MIVIYIYFFCTQCSSDPFRETCLPVTQFAIAVLTTYYFFFFLFDLSPGVEDTRQTSTFHDSAFFGLADEKKSDRRREGYLQTISWNAKAFKRGPENSAVFLSRWSNKANVPSLNRQPWASFLFLDNLNKGDEVNFRWEVPSLTRKKRGSDSFLAEEKKKGF